MKRIGILGTGQVANIIGNALIQLGYEVKIGSRTANNEKASSWTKSNGSMASNGTFTDAALFGQVIFNCTKGEHTLDVFKMAGISNFNDKIIIDVSNPIEFSKGMPPTLIPSLVNTNSLGEEIQKLLPGAKVVKTLNIVNCEVMVRASKCGGQATMFLAGNDSDAKKEVSNLLNQFGWDDLIDLGSIVHARSTEMMFPIWLSIYMATQNGYLAFKILR